MESKEDAMLRLIARLLPAHVVHDLGGGRAVDNAGRERGEVLRTMTIVDELAGRLRPSALTVGADGHLGPLAA
jgi:hypothetical protein